MLITNGGSWLIPYVEANINQGNIVGIINIGNICSDCAHKNFRYH